MTVGQGGSGGVGNSVGSNGSLSEFTFNGSSQHLIANPGVGGPTGIIAGTISSTLYPLSISEGTASGGTATGGDDNKPGGPGGIGMAVGLTEQFSSSYPVGSGGNGGNAGNGSGGAHATFISGAPVGGSGNNATGFGGGGSGIVATAIGTTTNATGGSGANGIVIITEVIA